MEEEKSGRTLKDLKEATKRAKIIVADMRKNRKDYGALDLAWRNIDMNMIVIECIDNLLELLSRKKKRESQKKEDIVPSVEVQSELPLRGDNDEPIDKSSGHQVGDNSKGKE